MKFLTHGHEDFASRPWVFNNTAENLEEPDSQGETEGLNVGPLAGNFLGNLNLKKAANGNHPSILNTNQESASGIQASDTIKNFQGRVDEIVSQGSDGAINAGIGGSYMSKVLTPPEFEGYTNLYLLNPFFLAPAGLTPAQVICSQFKEGFGDLGDPAELLGDSPLLSIKSAKALVREEAIFASIEGARNCGGHLNKMSLTSLQILEKVNEKTFEVVNKTNESRAAEFYAKSGYDINTGKRDPETGAVWWKRGIRKVLGQNYLYRKRVKVAKDRYKEGYDELRSNIRSLKRSKEESVFKIQQSIDETLIPLQSEGSADTIGLDENRKIVHRILNHPESFIKNPSSFNNGKYTVQNLFGNSFNPLDVIEALRAPKFEYLTMKTDHPDYLESAITTGQWKFNHYNSLRTLEGLNTRAKALNDFSSTSLETLERHINAHYEADNSDIDLDDPSTLVTELMQALGSAGNNLMQDLQDQIKNGSIYMSSTEIFWHIISLLGKQTDLSTFKNLPPDLQGKLAQFFLKKRTQLEQNTISGGIDEKGSLVWRVETLKQGQLAAESLSSFAFGLGALGSKLISTEEGVAQSALREIPTVFDNFGSFLQLLGASPNEEGFFTDLDAKELLDGVPEYEASILSNIVGLYPKVSYLKELYPKLVEDRKKLEELIDQEPEWVTARKQEYEDKSRLLEEVTRKGESGFGNSTVFGGMTGAGGAATTMDGSGEGGIGTGGGGLEAAWTAIRKDLERLTQFLNSGEDGGAIGKVAKIKSFTFPNLPGDTSKNIQRLADLSKRTIDRRLKELGLDSEEKIADLLDPNKKPSLDLLARNELYNTASKSIVDTGRALIGNDSIQQFENMKKTAYVGLETLSYAPSNYHAQLTVKSVTHPKTLQDALYVRSDKNGGIWYHTATQIIRITNPRLGSDDERNMAIWYKSPEERGLDKKFTIPPTNPDELGIFLTANPENEAAKNNALYGPVQEKIMKVLAANDNFQPNAEDDRIAA